MNYFVKSLVLFGVLAIAGTTAKAQLKIGYINSAELIELMPETKVVDSQLTVFAKGLEENLQTMQKTFDEKLADYREKQATMADASKQTRERERQDVNPRIQRPEERSVGKESVRSCGVGSAAYD